jgi:hypothetical protein
MSWMNILKNEDEMKNEFFKVIRREYENMGWAKSNEGEPSEYTEEGYPDFLIQGYEEAINEGLSVVDVIIMEIKENEIVMNSVKQDDPERAKYIQNFINELKGLMA